MSFTGSELGVACRVRVLPAGCAREPLGQRTNGMRMFWGRAYIHQLEYGEDFMGLYICRHLFVHVCLYMPETHLMEIYKIRKGKKRI